jgi:putative ABC transport system ATP-binding protein
MSESLPGAISGGQQQCAAVARALANDPPILVADEPTGNLDSASAESVLSLFETLVQQGKTILMVTHDRNLAKRANRSILISDGEVVDDLIARTFATLPDEKLLQLTLKSETAVYPGRSTIPARGKDGRPDILIIKNGFIRLKHCARMTEVYDDSVKVVPGQWLDMHWLADRCPDVVLNTEEYDQVEVIRIPGEEFQTITGGLVHFSAPGGLE